MREHNADAHLRWYQANGIFHVDSSFNPRRAGFSLLRAHELPPAGTGGNTDFADTRTAFDDLPQDLRQRLFDNNYVGAHSIWHSRRKGAPKDSPWTKDVKVEDFPFGRHKVSLGMLRCFEFQQPLRGKGTNALRRSCKPTSSQAARTCTSPTTFTTLSTRTESGFHTTKGIH